MHTPPTVAHLFTCPSRGAPVVSHQSVRAVTGSGIVGDRWYRSRWTYLLRRLNAWRKGKAFMVTHVSLITLADIATGSAIMGETWTPEQMRRNVVLAGGQLDLNALVGRVFRIGGVLLRGDNPCTPCALPPLRSGRPKLTAGFLKAFGHTDFKTTNYGGLRCAVLRGGAIRIGDTYDNET